MPYKFEAVDIIISDIHTVVKPLLSSSVLKDNFQFLTDRDKYNEKFKLRKIEKTDAYIFHPVTKKELNWNHFWKNYTSQDDTAITTDFYNLQIPFVFKPKNFDLTISFDSLKAEIKPTVFLFSTGWSSNLRISLTGSISSGKLQKFIGDLKNSNPYLISGQNYKLSAVFAELAKRVKNEVYNSPQEIGDNPFKPNYFFISLQKSSSQPEFFAPVQINHSSKQYKQMLEADKSELFGILYGREVNISELSKYEKKSANTWFNDANFAVTDFNNGSLLFMQENACSENPQISTLECLNSNIRLCTVLTFMILGFKSRVDKLNSIEDFKLSPILSDLSNRTDYRLQLIKGAFNNPYCITFYQNYGSLNTIGQKKQENDS